MSFRTRLTLVAAAAVAFAVVVASLVVFLVVRNQLRGQVDDALQTRAQEIAQGPHPPRLEQTPAGQRYLDVGEPPGFGGGDFVQVVDSKGNAIETLSDAGKLPPNGDALEAAKGHKGTSFSDASIGGTDVRVYTIPVRDEQGNTYALQVARSLGEVNHTLHRITIFLILIAVGGVTIAGGL